MSPEQILSSVPMLSTGVLPLVFLSSSGPLDVEVVQIAEEDARDQDEDPAH